MVFVLGLFVVLIVIVPWLIDLVQGDLVALVMWLGVLNGVLFGVWLAGRFVVAPWLEARSGRRLADVG